MSWIFVFTFSMSLGFMSKMMVFPVNIFNILEDDGTFYTLTHVMTKHGFESRATGGHHNLVDL